MLPAELHDKTPRRQLLAQLQKDDVAAPLLHIGMQRCHACRPVRSRQVNLAQPCNSSTNTSQECVRLMG